MISRVADHCFWFGRYIERAEATARMLAASLSLALDAELPPSQVWRPVVVVSGEESRFATRVATDDDHPAWGDGEAVQRFMVWDDDTTVSLARSIHGMRWNARSVREVLSHEAWEAVNELHLWMHGDLAPATYAQHRDTFYQHIRRGTQLALGLLRSTMLHDEPLDFVWLGVLLERVNQTARMLDVHHHAFTQMSRRHEVVETALWLSLLRALSGSEAYLKRAAGRISSEGVARFLVSEPAFPRSIAYCVHSAYSRLCDIRPPESHDLPGGVALERLRVLDTWVAARRAESLTGSAVHDLLTHVVDEISVVCEAIHHNIAGEGQRAYGRIIPARADGVRNMVIMEPIGPVAGFAPWNFPVTQAVRKIAASLAAGCSIILKCPEETPGSPIGLASGWSEVGTNGRTLSAALAAAAANRAPTR